MSSSTLGKRGAADAGLRDDPASVRKTLASSQLRTTMLERRVLDLEQQLADKDRTAEDLRSENARLEEERHQLFESATRVKNDSDAQAKEWAAEKADYDANLRKYRTQARQVSGLLEEQQSTISKLQRNYNRVLRDLEEKEALYTERIKVLQDERDQLRQYEQRSQHLAIEVEELRRKADAKRSRSPTKADDGMRSEIRRQSVSLQSQQSKIDQLQGEVYELRRWKKDADVRERQAVEEKAKLRRQAQTLEDEVMRLRHERDSLTQSFNGATDDEVAQLQARLAALDKVHQELASKYAATTAELDEARRRAGQISDDSMATILDLKERVHRLERAERNASEGQRYAEARVEGLKRELEAARSGPGGDGPWGNKMRALEASITEYKSALDLLQAEAAEVEERVARGAGLVKAQALENAEARASSLECEKAELEASVEELTKANTALDADIAELMRRVASGEYNSERERVLEVRDNPAARVHAVRRAQLDDLRTENAALLARLKELDTTPSEGGNGLVPRASYDRLEKERDTAAAAHEKRLLRLKEIFGLKSREFLEAVYSLLGWRIKFEENGGELRLTSMYAPKGKMGLTLKFTSDEGHFGTMHMSGAMKRGLEEAHQFWVIERQSIPGFLAQVTTEMFEKTTFGRAAGYVGLGVEQ
ncbi:putative mitotic spindle checkpoint-related protein [Cutaneotrichosporon oleaginosum]|uniref:Spindle assembly checkpoint component MAD1 n=1 Tax=Cutaneotrichosporon oleaginosum TaxID=879819 RepID=A0A0J0XFD1_9TREE|nr:putative mitotic spindle checkpoint-related protein [Cutaneotrichosporon oleaginosum]KLT39777.1 putative mitotic spindle checkpoint-related protein [Cutaneotrichosporon oleaginosum]TXT05677.1 hypothetical protein COLE_06997 [Cutaneotrichosporon oleaginosum]